MLQHYQDLNNKIMKEYLLKLWADVLAKTPKVYQWFCGVLVSLGVTAGVASAAFENLPVSFQAYIPTTALKAIAILALAGAVFAKKQNVK